MKKWVVIACICTISISLFGIEPTANEKKLTDSMFHFLWFPGTITAKLDQSEAISNEEFIATSYERRGELIWQSHNSFQETIKNGTSRTKEEMHQTPQYLYKILSLRNWRATESRKTVQLSAEDDAFVHLSTEDQLEKISAKYWADAPEYVVLKIESSKLEGKLVFETNPGGTTCYYHLYEGFIPFNAIVESRIVYQHSEHTCKIETLDVVQVGHPVLRQMARELSIEEITSAEFQDLIEKMKATMRAAPGVGLAAPQIGKSLQLAVIEDMDQSFLTAEQIAERNRYPVPFHVIINPKLYIEKSTPYVEFFEGCLSVPEFLGAVPRAEAVRVECLNENGKPIVIHAKGWYARILQHEIDHLNGKIYIDRVLLPTLITTGNYVKLYKNKSVKEVLAALSLKPKNLEMVSLK